MLVLDYAFFCSQQLGVLMIERGYGKNINMSSTWSIAAEAGKSVYCSAKAARWGTAANGRRGDTLL